MPPPKKRRRKMGKLRIDKNIQIPMEVLRAQRMDCSDQMFSEIILTNFHNKDANTLLQNNFPLKNKSSKLNQMLKKAADDEKFFEDVSDGASEISLRAPLAAAAAKKVMRAKSFDNYCEAFESEAIEQDKLALSNDFRNAVESFFKKEKPIFKGN